MCLKEHVWSVVLLTHHRLREASQVSYTHCRRLLDPASCCQIIHLSGGVLLSEEPADAGRSQELGPLRKNAAPNADNAYYIVANSNRSPKASPRYLLPLAATACSAITSDSFLQIHFCTWFYDVKEQERYKAPAQYFPKLFIEGFKPL